MADDGMTSAASGLLDGVRVLDLGGGMAAALVARFLADTGAQVTRIAPAGDAVFAELYPAYTVWHGGAVCGRVQDLPGLLAEADICLIGGEDHPDVIRSAPFVASTDHPRLIVIEIGGNPPDMDGSDRPSTEILAQAHSGLAFEHYADRPLAMAFAPASIGAAFQALIGGVAALFEREGSGLGQHVRTSLLEGAMSWLPMFWAEFEKPTPAVTFVAPKDALPLIFRCRDGGFVHIVIGAAGSKYKLYQVLGIDDPAVLPGDSGLPRPGGDPRNFYGDIDLLARHCRTWDRDALLQALWAAGLPAEPVLPPGACWDDPQIRRNGIIATATDGTRSVGLPFRAERSACATPRAMPTGRRPLDGVRVIDFGAYVAGPLASQLLTGLGADVIKVEPPTGEPSRGLVRGYLAANRGKRGVAIDMKSDAGRRQAQALALDAAVVCSNFRGGVAERLGIDASSLLGQQPDLIVLESPAYGSEGPSATRAGFDMVMQAVTGLEIRGGLDRRADSDHGQPLWNRLSMVDFAAGTLGAIAILCALYARRRNGDGARLEMPLVNAGLYLLSELIQHADGSFAGADPVDGDGTALTPHDALYQATDGWIAVSARGAAASAAFDGLSGNGATKDATRAGMAKLVGSLSAAQAVDRLRSAGLWAEICSAEGQARIFSNPALIARGMVRETLHAQFGRTLDLGPMFSLSRSALGNDVPLHGVGEHDALLAAVASDPLSLIPSCSVYDRS